MFLSVVYLLRMTYPTQQSVALVQTRLSLETGSKRVVDGVFSTELGTAIGAWQKKAGMTPSGRIVDALPELLPGLVLDENGDPAWHQYMLYLYGDVFADPKSVPVKGTHGGFLPKGVVVHHTAGARDTPPRFLKEGREDVSGPLYCFTANRTGLLDAISNGRTHNAGKGDPRVLASMLAVDTPLVAPRQDAAQGNSHFYGCVLEHSGKDSEPVVTAARLRLIQCCAMWCHAWGWDPLKRVIGHKEWTRRKPDPIFDMQPFRHATVGALAALQRRICEPGEPVKRFCPTCGTQLKDNAS